MIIIVSNILRGFPPLLLHDKHHQHQSTPTLHYTTLLHLSTVALYVISVQNISVVAATRSNNSDPGTHTYTHISYTPVTIQPAYTTTTTNP